MTRAGQGGLDRTEGALARLHCPARQSLPYQPIYRSEAWLSRFLEELVSKLREAQVTLAPTRPRVLLGPDDVGKVRTRARAKKGS